MNSLKPAIPYGRQSLSSSDLEAVRHVLESDWITQGPKIGEFENALAAYCGVRFAVAVSNGTAALHLACLAAGVSAGDEAITTPISFAATANAAVYCGGRPVFADVQYRTANIDSEAVKKLISKRTRAILPVHMAGLPADLKEIRSLASKHGLKVIEDACHALGAEYRGERIGSCRYSDMTIFSFHPVKHITTGEGGCITTNNETIYKKLKALRNHGIYKDETVMKQKGGWAYEMRDLGFNYRITDIQCALGISQLERLENFLKRRSEIAASYQHAFAELEDRVLLPAEFPDRKSAWHLYLLRLNLKKVKTTRRKFYDFLKNRGVMAQVHYIPIYKHSFYQKFLRGKRINCPNAEKYYEEVISLPMFPDLAVEDQGRVIQAVKEGLA